MDGNDDTAENVIRLPRDWVGPPEELVPMGSRARAREETARREAAEREEQARDDGLGDRVLDAGDFWGESASAVHNAMWAPREPETVGPTPVAQPPRVRGVPRPRSRPLSRVRLPHAPTWWTRPGGRRVGWRAAAVAVAIATVAVVATIGISEGSSPGPATTTQARVQEPATLHQRPTPGSDRLGATAGRTAVAGAIPDRSFPERPSVRHGVRRHRRANRGAAGRGADSAGTTTGHVSVVTATVTASEPTTTPSTDPVATEGTHSATTARDGATDASSGGGGSGGSSQPPGPLGPGDATGCNPKCS